MTMKEFKKYVEETIQHKEELLRKLPMTRTERQIEEHILIEYKDIRKVINSWKIIYLIWKDKKRNKWWFVNVRILRDSKGVEEDEISITKRIRKRFTGIM